MLLDTRWKKVTSKSVLIVDDDAAIQDSIREILELEGYSVDTAGTGREAMELVPGANDVSRLSPGVYFVRGEGTRIQGSEGSSERLSLTQRHTHEGGYP